MCLSMAHYNHKQTFEIEHYIRLQPLHLGYCEMLKWIDVGSGLKILLEQRIINEYQDWHPKVGTRKFE